MFGFLKSSTTTSGSSTSFEGGFKSKQREFLEKADYAYLLTFKTMDMAHFARYASRALYMTIYHSITLERPWAGVSDKFKKTTWELIESDENGQFLAHKVTVFDKVNVSRQLKLSVADDYEELWGVVKNVAGEYVVEKIQQM